jgi:hypothetical protein
MLPHLSQRLKPFNTLTEVQLLIFATGADVADEGVSAK